MTLVDTSVWVHHLRMPVPALAQLLSDDRAGIHALVIGELAMGTLKDREKTLAALRKLPHAATVSDEEVHHLLEAHRLWGLGLGWIDLSLLASAALTGWGVLTADRVMSRVAARLKINSVN